MTSRILRYSDARHARRLSVIELLSDTENRKIGEIRALIMHLCLFFTWFNLVKPHNALKIEIADGKQRWIAQDFD